MDKVIRDHLDAVARRVEQLSEEGRLGDGTILTQLQDIEFRAQRWQRLVGLLLTVVREHGDEALYHLCARACGNVGWREAEDLVAATLDAAIESGLVVPASEVAETDNEENRNDISRDNDRDGESRD